MTSGDRYGVIIVMLGETEEAGGGGGGRIFPNDKAPNIMKDNVLKLQRYKLMTCYIWAGLFLGCNQEKNYWI